MLQLNQLSVEEVAQRRGELRKMRELMFRAEFKARRSGKIKSKTYRRMRRKEKELIGEKINKDDGDDDSSVEVGTQEAALTLKGKGKESHFKEFEKRDVVTVASSGLAVVPVASDDDDSGSEVGVQEAVLTLKRKGKASDIKAFEQRDLVAAAFSGDNVVKVCSHLSRPSS